MLCLAKRRFLKDLSGETLVFDFMLELKISKHVLAVGLKINIRLDLIFDQIFDRFRVDFEGQVGSKIDEKSAPRATRKQERKK